MQAAGWKPVSFRQRMSLCIIGRNTSVRKRGGKVYNGRGGAGGGGGQRDAVKAAKLWPYNLDHVRVRGWLQVSIPQRFGVFVNVCCSMSLLSLRENILGQIAMCWPLVHFKSTEFCMRIDRHFPLCVMAVTVAWWKKHTFRWVVVVIGLFAQSPSDFLPEPFQNIVIYKRLLTIC